MDYSPVDSLYEFVGYKFAGELLSFFSGIGVFVLVVACGLIPQIIRAVKYGEMSSPLLYLLYALCIYFIFIKPLVSVVPEGVIIREGAIDGAKIRDVKVPIGYWIITQAINQTTAMLSSRIQQEGSMSINEEIQTWKTIKEALVLTDANLIKEISDFTRDCYRKVVLAQSDSLRKEDVIKAETYEKIEDSERKNACQTQLHNIRTMVYNYYFNRGLPKIEQNLGLRFGHDRGVIAERIADSLLAERLITGGGYHSHEGVMDPASMLATSAIWDTFWHEPFGRPDGLFAPLIAGLNAAYNAAFKATSMILTGVVNITIFQGIAAGIMMMAPFLYGFIHCVILGLYPFSILLCLFSTHGGGSILRWAQIYLSVKLWVVVWVMITAIFKLAVQKPLVSFLADSPFLPVFWAAAVMFIATPAITGALVGGASEVFGGVISLVLGISRGDGGRVRIPAGGLIESVEQGGTAGAAKGRAITGGAIAGPVGAIIGAVAGGAIGGSKHIFESHKQMILGLLGYTGNGSVKSQPPAFNAEDNTIHQR